MSRDFRSYAVTLVGLGNTGRPLAGYIARIPGVGRITLVDFDVYESSNILSQGVDPADVGRPKVEATAAELKRIDPELRIVPLQVRVENVPLGRLRADVILGCVDSKLARLVINELATRLGGIPVVDTGVEPDHQLARLTVYRPGPAEFCFECGLQATDYENIEQVLPCIGGPGRAPGQALPTRAPAYLGGYAASLAAAECEKLLSDDAESSMLGKELVVSVSDHSRFITNLHRKPRCRADHATWSEIERLDEGPDQINLGQLLGLGPVPAGRSSVQVRVPAQRFFTRLQCRGCGTQTQVLHLSGRLPEGDCANCGGRMVAPGFTTFDFLSLGALPDRILRRSLRSIGFLSGDVFKLSRGPAEAHYEIGGGVYG